MCMYVHLHIYISTVKDVDVKLSPGLPGKAAFKKKKKKKIFFTRKLDLNLRKKLVKCYTWSIALYGAENWTFREVE